MANEPWLLYLDWNVIAGWADDGDDDVARQIVDRQAHGELIVVFSRQHVIEALAARRPDVPTDTRWERRLTRLDDLSRTEVVLNGEVRPARPRDVAIDLTSPDQARYVQEIREALQPKHNEVLEALAAQTGVPIADLGLPANTDARLEDLSNRSTFALTKGVQRAARVTQEQDTNHLNGLSGQAALDVVNASLDAVLAGRRPRSMRELMPILAPTQPLGHVAGAVAVLNALGFHRDKEGVSGRSLVIDPLHVQNASWCDVFVTADRRLRDRARLTFELFGDIPTRVLSPVELRDAFAGC